jgi:tripartite ATP-independent transporter DctM subunit
MMDSAGLFMLLAVAVVMIGTGLPSWIVLVGVAMVFAAGGAAMGVFPAALITALPSRVIGLLEHDLLQALPLYVFMGALLHRLPLADTVFRVFSRSLQRTPAGRPLAGLALSVLLAPMNGSAGASAAMLSRIVQPKLIAGGTSVAQSAALTCISSTLGVVIPPSLVLILLGDAMLRAHTEAMNIAGRGTALRIINTQDVFHGALIPAAMLVALCALVTWRVHRRAPRADSQPSAVSRIDIVVALSISVFITALLAAVALGHLYAVEAAATGGVALVSYGMLSGSLSREAWREVLHHTMAVTGALFALLLAATVFTLVVRAFGTDRWIAAWLNGLGDHQWLILAIVLAALALCALVLDAFEMIFVVIPLLLPPLLVQVPDATWVAVLTLLILQTSFIVPPFGYAVMMVRNLTTQSLETAKLIRALAPYLFAQLVVLAAVLAFPTMLWRDQPGSPASMEDTPATGVDAAEMLNRQLNQNQENQESEERKPVPAAK